MSLILHPPSAYDLFLTLLSEQCKEAEREKIFNTLIQKPLSAELLAEGVRALREHMTPVTLSPDAIDTCGTGGSGMRTINTSTLTALIVTACGGKVAKHGNRSASGNCGCFDLLEHMGIRIDLTPAQEKKIFDELGIVFLFAPAHHPSLRFVAPLRKQHGKKTIFNLIGPLCNPAGNIRQMIGTGSAEHAPMIAAALQRLGSVGSLVVRGNDGLDEVTSTTTTTLYSVQQRSIVSTTFSPSTVDVPLAHPSDIEGGTVEENARIFTELLQGKGDTPKKNLVLLNAAHALTIAGIAPSLRTSFALAQDALRSGKAAHLFLRYKEHTSHM